MEQLLDENVLGTTTLRFGTFWERFVAVLIDTLIVAIPTMLLAYALPVVGNVLGLVIGIGYYVYFESSEKMATIGKSAMGLKVVDADTNGRITVGKAVGRYFGKFLSGIILLIGYFMMLFNDKKQTLHDKLAGTLVIKG